MGLILGTVDSDVIIGTSEADEIRLLGADDFVFSGEGDDIIFGGVGFDHIFGGFGDDYISGGRGADFIHGGRGDDDLWGGPAGVSWVDTFHFGANTGRDVIWDWRKVDRINIDAIGIDAKSDLTLRNYIATAADGNGACEGLTGVRITWGTIAAIVVLGDFDRTDFVANDFLFG